MRAARVCDCEPSNPVVLSFSCWCGVASVWAHHHRLMLLLPLKEMVVLNEHRGSLAAEPLQQQQAAAYPPKPYRVRPWRLRAYTTSMAVTVLRRACSV